MCNVFAHRVTNASEESLHKAAFHPKKEAGLLARAQRVCVQLHVLWGPPAYCEAREPPMHRLLGRALPKSSLPPKALSAPAHTLLLLGTALVPPALATAPLAAVAPLAALVPPAMALALAVRVASALVPRLAARRARALTRAPLVAAVTRGAPSAAMAVKTAAMATTPIV